MIWAVWAGLAVLGVALVAGTAIVAARALELWRRLRATQRELLAGLEQVGDGAQRTAELAEQATRSPELERSLARLRESHRRLSVLRSAIDDVTGAVSRVTAVYPRK